MTKEELKLKQIIYDEIGLDSPDSELQSAQKMQEEDAIICRARIEAAKEAEREAVINLVLDILDRYYLWHLDKNGGYVTVGEEIKAAVSALKGE